MIYYENENWYIKDGGKEKASGSGTWLFLDKKYEINNDIIFMVGPSTIKLEYILPGENEKKEENEDDSLEYDDNNDNINNNIINNRNKEGFELSLLSDGLNNLKNKIKKEELDDKKSDMSLYSIKTDYKVNNNNNNFDTINYDN